MKELLKEYITKIEGHGSLKICFSSNTCELQIDEGERLFEGLILGRNYKDAPILTARICGVCPVAHTVASIVALENALDIRIPEHIDIIRRIMLSLQIVQSHILHLFFLALPDYLHISSTLELAESDPEIFKTVLSLKKLADEGIELIGGRAIHPVTMVVGGFTKLPSYQELKKYGQKVEKEIYHALEAASLFAHFKYPNVDNEKIYLSLVDKSFPLIGEKVLSSDGKSFNVQDYQENIEEKIKPYSNAKFSTKNKKGFMVGAISRINLKKPLLNPKAFEIAADKFPTNNPYKNNLAQAIEMVHYMEEIVLLIQKINQTDLNQPRIEHKVKAGKGVGAIEAPRGTLYHYYQLNSKGLIIDCDIIPPTAQNLTSIENDAAVVLVETEKIDEHQRKELLEMLIRAYDPCITCSVH